MKSCLRIPTLLVLLLLSACASIDRETIHGSGILDSEDRPVQGVTRVSLTTLGELTIQLGDNESLVVEAEDNLLQYIETSVVGGKLTIRSAQNVNLEPTRSVRYTLTVSSLAGLEVSSSGSITAPALAAEKFDLQISSSGNITLAGLTADHLTVDISSSGNLEIGAGEVSEQTVNLSSSGNYRAGELRSQTADVTNSSSGTVTLWVTNQLKVDLSSSGNVNYYGEPAVTEETSSSGKAVPLGIK